MLVAAALLVVSLCAIIVLFWRDVPALVNYAYPAAALGTALWLYSTRPALYLGFTWWIWFITPFVRRLVDYEVGFHDPVSLVMLAPYLVTGVAILTVVNAIGRLTQRAYRPFLLIILGIIYGFAIGLVKVGAFSATFALLSWLLPVVFGLHIYLHPKLVSVHTRVMLSTFAGGVLVMGIYGVLQYVYVTPWDAKWLLDSGMWKTMGRPDPGNFRIFSTLNSTGPFAFVMAGGLLLLFTGKSAVRWVAAAPGYFGLLLSLVRAAWGGWFVGVAYLAWRLQGRMKMRLVTLLVVAMALSVPIFMFAPNTNRAAARAETLTNLNQDTSFRARVGIHVRGMRAFFRTPIGNGLGNYGTAAKLSKGDVVSFDSGVFHVLLVLGWVGTLLYVSGLLWLLTRMFRLDHRARDPVATTFAAVVFAFLAMMLFVNTLTGLLGMMVWPFLGLALARMERELQNAQPIAAL
jgi:hypothetical protein